MANPYISPQEQSLYEAFVRQATEGQETEEQYRNRIIQRGRYNSIDAALRNDLDPELVSSQRRVLGDKVSYSQEDVNGRQVNVGRVNDAEDFNPGARGYYSAEGDYIVAPRGTPLLKGSQENAQKTLDHELEHASRQEQLKNYQSNLRWEDRPEEARAEIASLNKFKERLRVMGIPYTEDMGTRYLLGLNGGIDVSHSKTPIKGKPNTIPSDAPLTHLDGYNPAGGVRRTLLDEPVSQIQRMLELREAPYSSGRLPNIEVFSDDYRNRTEQYHRPLMAAKIASGQHPVQRGE